MTVRETERGTDDTSNDIDPSERRSRAQTGLVQVVQMSLSTFPPGSVANGIPPMWQRVVRYSSKERHLHADQRYKIIGVLLGPTTWRVGVKITQSGLHT